MPIEHTEGYTNASEYLFKNQNFTLKYFFLKISYIFTEYFVHIYLILPPSCSPGVPYIPSLPSS